MSPLVTNALLLASGIVVLYFGAEWLVRGAARLARLFGVSPIVVGLTVVAMGTSAPELAVSLLATLGDNAELAVGNVMGSNLANLGLILGLTSMIRPLQVAGRVVTREMPVMLGVTVLLFPLAWDGELTFADGLILVVVLVLYLLFVTRAAKGEVPEVKETYVDVGDGTSRPGIAEYSRNFALVVVGSAGLVLGGGAIVGGAEFLALELGIPDTVVGLTVVAVGTSLPELATAVVAAFEGEADIAVGNVVGSNVFNIAAILGITSLVTPVDVADTVIRNELLAVLAISLLAWPITHTAGRVRRSEGALLLAVYVALTIWLV